MSTVDIGRSTGDTAALSRATRASAGRRPETSIALRALLIALAYVFMTGGLLTALLVQLREEAMSAARRELAAFAQLTATHTFEVAFALEQKLKLAEVTLAVAAGSGSADQESIGPMLQELVSKSRELKDILVLDAAGRVVNEATGTADIGLDWSAQPFFNRVRDRGGQAFAFGVPQQSQTSSFHGHWFIPVTLARRGQDGEFKGVVVGLMDPAYFSKAWTFDSEIWGLSIALTAADGTILMRQPFAEAMLGQRPSDQETIARLAQNRAADTLIAPQPQSQEPELQAYRRVGAYPDLLVFVAQPLAIATEAWRRVALISASCWMLASLALAGLGLWLASEMRARGAIERRYHALFNSIPQAVLVSDVESGEVLACNDAAVEQYGWSGVGGPPRLGPDFAVLAKRRAEFSRERACLISGQRQRNAQGAPIDVELTVRQIDVGGRPALLTVAADVSDRLREERARRSAEDQLRQSQKMDTLGQLTGGIAHDFNNALMVITDSVEELSERAGLDPETRSGLDRIAGSAKRAEELTRRMLAFSQKQPLRPRTTNINDLVVDIGRLLRRTLGEHIEVDSMLVDEVWPVDVDPSQLETSLVNLCLNARAAMPEGGRVVIETANVVLHREQLLRAPGVAPGEFVQITVRDNGVGIAPQHLDKIFEPFFTTKPSGTGSGLGLSMVYGFIRQSNGYIEVESELGRGAVFRIYLPRRTGQAATPAQSRQAEIKGGSERVLVVEDDTQVRASVVRQLRSLGYAVADAANGSEGLAAFEAAAPPFDLLLTDVVMPGPMNGRALADEVLRRQPRAKIVFMSGYTGNVLGEGSDRFLLLNKPFRKADLARMVRAALDGSAS